MDEERIERIERIVRMGTQPRPRCLATEASHRCKAVGVFAWKEGLKRCQTRSLGMRGFSIGFLNGVPT